MRKLDCLFYPNLRHLVVVIVRHHLAATIADHQFKRLYLIMGVAGSVIFGTVLGVLINSIIYLFHH
jgi:hypothetical protein